MASPSRIATVSIVMGSDSDLKIMKPAASILESFGIPYEMKVLSAHRTPKQTMQYSETAYQRGIRVIIAGAGGAAHLAGSIAASTHLPVIGVPVALPRLDGLDSLLSMVQMPRGVPVATVAINNSTNAALLAVQMLSIVDLDMAGKMMRYKKKMEQDVLEKKLE